MSADVATAGGRRYGAQHEKPETSLAAIRGLGTNGLPFIMRKLGRREMPVTKWIQTGASKCGVKRALFPNPEVERAQAVTALAALRPLPSEFIVQLRNLSKQGTNRIALSAAYALRADTSAEGLTPGSGR
jgi:hypothetical protein